MGELADKLGFLAGACLALAEVGSVWGEQLELVLLVGVMVELELDLHLGGDAQP